MSDKVADSKAVPLTVDVSKYIEVRIFGERPHIRNRRIPVATIAYNAHSHQWSVAETADNFGISEAEVLASLLYYAEHQAAIDEQEMKEQAMKDELYQKMVYI